MLYISNGFSLNMLSLLTQTSILVTPLSDYEVKNLLLAIPAISIVGHENTSIIMSDLLHFPIACNRQTVKLGPGDILIVGQYTGPRLTEGAIELPDGASITWLKVQFRDTATWAKNLSAIVAGNSDSFTAHDVAEDILNW